MYKSAEYLVYASAKFCTKLGLSEAWFGLIIIATETSLPVMFISTQSLILNDSDAAFGSILGTNMMIIGLVIGSLGLFSRAEVQKSKVFENSFFMIWGLVLLPLFLLLDGYLSRIDGFALLIAFIYYLLYHKLILF